MNPEYVKLLARFRRLLLEEDGPLPEFLLPENIKVPKEESERSRRLRETILKQCEEEENAGGEGQRGQDVQDP